MLETAFQLISMSWEANKPENQIHCRAVYWTMSCEYSKSWTAQYILIGGKLSDGTLIGEFLLQHNVSDLWQQAFSHLIYSQTHGSEKHLPGNNSHILLTEWCPTARLTCSAREPSDSALKNIVFWYVTPCSPVGFHRRFRGIHPLHIQRQANNLHYSCLLLGLLFDAKYRGSTLLRNVG
jgi:hypothetical protein